MPNQLAESKRRQSLAEHNVVLDAIAEIARRENTTTMALLREAARDLIRRRTVSPGHAAVLRSIARRAAPLPPRRFKSPAQVARFKRAQREYDRLILDLRIATPVEVQNRNSPVSLDEPVRVIEFDRAHASAPL